MIVIGIQDLDLSAVVERFQTSSASIRRNECAICHFYYLLHVNEFDSILDI